MKKLPLASMLFVALIACSTTTATTTAAEPTTSNVPESTTTSSPAESTTTSSPASGCGDGDSAPMVDEGPVYSIDQDASDAERIGAITWDTNVACENFIIEFVTAEGAPATTPPSITAEFLRDVGILRVAVDVEMTVSTDQLVQSALVERLFVARKLDGTRSLFIDFHLAEPAVARVSVGISPGQLLVQLEAGGDPYPSVPAVTENIVLISPVEGPVENPVSLSGYSRNFEANTVGRITQGDNVLAEGFTTAADWVETWGEFSLDLEATGSGEADLFAGEFSAQDGSPRGVVVVIELP